MKRNILIVDDIPMNREILSEILEDEYNIIEASDGIEAMGIINDPESHIDVILLDILMPRMDGFEVMSTLKDMGMSEKVPILVISTEQSVKVENKCFDYDVADFIRKPFDHNLVRKRVSNVAQLYTYKKELEDRVEVQTQTLRKQYKLLLKQADKLGRNNRDLIDILATIVESRNLESGEHVQRVKEYTKILALQAMKDYPEYELDETNVEHISAASALHDIGKICISDTILLKPGKLTPEEFDEMKLHTVKGCELLDEIRKRDIWDAAYDKACYEICRSHHERYDGHGYPDGLQGEEIPISAQLVSIADVYDALVNERVYKKAIPKDEAFDMIINGKCGVFSPKLLSCFTKVRNQFENLKLDGKSK